MKYFERIEFSPILKNNLNKLTELAYQFLLNTNQGASSTLEITRKQLLEGISYPFRIAGRAKYIGALLGIQEDAFAESMVAIELTEPEFNDDGFDRIGFVLERKDQAGNLVATYYSKAGQESKVNNRIAEANLASVLRNTIEAQLYFMAFALANAYAFPSERKALISSIGFAQLPGWQQARDGSFSKPVVDYMDFLYRLAVTPQGPRPLRTETAILEKILGVEISLSEGKLPRDVRFSIQQGSQIKIHGASSLVKSLSGLDLYFKESAPSDGTLLIIDEPEMNAHPKAQMEIIEFLALIVNRGSSRSYYYSQPIYRRSSKKSIISVQAVSRKEVRSVGQVLSEGGRLFLAARKSIGLCFWRRWISQEHS